MGLLLELTLLQNFMLYATGVAPAAFPVAEVDEMKEVAELCRDSFCSLKVFCLWLDLYSFGPMHYLLSRLLDIFSLICSYLPDHSLHMVILHLKSDKIERFSIGMESWLFYRGKLWNFISHSLEISMSIFYYMFILCLIGGSLTISLFLLDSTTIITLCPVV